jgi:RNA polymerase sigma-70 factor (ECF subfamily)
MTPAMPASQAEFTPYLLQQTGLRASLLQTSFGFAGDDWDDLRQDLALDCLRRLPKFDSSRGDWRGFVRGVVRNHACVLASRQMRRPEARPLWSETGTDSGDGSSTGRSLDVSTEDFRPVLDLSLDTRRVLAGLPEDLQTFARYLAEMPLSAIRRRTGLSRSQMAQKLRRIRAAFEGAGLLPPDASPRHSSKEGGRG